MPVTLEAARRHCMSAGRLAVAVAITANAASFLLPTSDITSLLLLGRTSLPALAYLRGSWLAWLLVVAVTVGSLSGWLARAGTGPPRASSARPSGRAALDLVPMFAAASAIRAILATAIGPGLLLTGSVATLICRRIARDAGAVLSAWQFTAVGSVLVPAQLAAAAIGLHLAGALR